MKQFKRSSGNPLYIRAFALIFLALLVFLGVYIIFTVRGQKNQETEELLKLWNDGLFRDAYELSNERLTGEPLNYDNLVINGFAAYQLGEAQITNASKQEYFDDAIWSLRKALLQNPPWGREKETAQIYYCLGKAYYRKGIGYEDLTIQYFEKAETAGLNADDLYEFLGLAYAATGDYRSSVAAFTKLLNQYESDDNAPSDLLLLAIARSYSALEQYASAKAYLIRCIDTSRDDITKLEARLFLAELMQKSGDTTRAELQYQTILAENGDNAEAYFQLGEIYNAQGDTVKARAEWRKAIRTDPTHPTARERLGLR
ncbi:MAG: tetratricopeptide repeat protein [Spirochaetaceae bacterium]|jgi:tetratricopeptide (TPR) repeat protein|nr:tetratricopeptide repeat protein [Spirochaetaceae bacterium]